MIKVQPAHSRLLKTETAEQLTITCPPKGFLGIGGCLVIVGACLLLLLGNLIVPAFQSEETAFRYMLCFAMMPAIAFVLGGLTIFRASWSISRSAEWITFVRGGLWGKKVRRWHPQEVTTFWVSEQFMSEGPNQQTLIVGFSNGRSERLIEDHGMKEDFNWICALMRERKGAAKAASVLRLVAEPVIRRVDPAVIPPAVAVRRFPDGVELTFLPLLDFKRRWWKLLATSLLGISTILIVAQILIRLCGSSYPTWVTRWTAVGWVFYVIHRLMILMQKTVVQVLDGQVTIIQNHGRDDYQFPVSEVEFVQTFRTSGETELQFLRKGKPKVRLLEDRPSDELEWAARYLRVAIKGRAPEEAAVMKMETAAGECQVCGEKMESRVIFCAKCRTPHHEECWSYIGQCSTFACREIRFTRT